MAEQNVVKRMIAEHGSVEAALCAAIKAGWTRRQTADYYGSTPANIRNMAKRRGIVEYDNPNRPMPSRSVKGAVTIKNQPDVSALDRIHLANMAATVTRYDRKHPMFEQVAREILARRQQEFVV